MLLRQGYGRARALRSDGKMLEFTPRVDLGGWVAFADLEGVGAKCLQLSGNCSCPSDRGCANSKLTPQSRTHGLFCGKE